MRGLRFLLPFFLTVAASAGVRIVLVGDSAANDQAGWVQAGWIQGFRNSFGPGVQVTGRRDEAARPDYILIEAGPGDAPDDLARSIREARAAGAKPVLVTPIVRRLFGPDGKLSPGPLPASAYAAARDQGLPLMDLYALTRAQAGKLGPEGCLALDALDKDARPDATRLGPVGRHDIGILAAREFARVVPAIRPLLATAAAPVQVTVAQDGSGDFRTIQMAVDHAPQISGAQRLVIEIAPGTYPERVVVPQDRPRTTFLGRDAAGTVITAAMSAKAAGGTFFSSTVDVEGAGFEAENITFENTFGVGSQAVAIEVHSDRAVFRKCRFLGWQDTLYAATGRQYYQDCFIEGHVDFIFGNAAAVFDRCQVHSRGEGYIAAQSRTAPDMPTGFVFSRCRLTGENTGKGVYLGRPWRPYSRVVFLDTAMDAHIRPEGWENWRDPKNEKTAWYGESGSSGPGASAAARVPWSRQLTPAQAALFEAPAFLRGTDGWNPTASRASR